MIPGVNFISNVISLISMKAIILCAGYATRLYPLTRDRPKALLLVKGKALLDYTIEKIPEEINEIILVSNDRFYKSLLEWSQKYGDRIKVLNDETLSNEDRLGGIGDLWFVIGKEKINDDILVIAGDNLFDLDLAEFVDEFKKINKTMLGICELDSEEIKKMGVVEIDDNNKLISFEEKPEKPKSNLASTGIYAFTKDDLKRIAEYMKTDESKDGPGFLIKYFCQKQDIYAFELKGRWFDIGSIETYEKVNEVW